jgi:hypothetical protein
LEILQLLLHSLSSVKQPFQIQPFLHLSFHSNLTPNIIPRFPTSKPNGMPLTIVRKPSGSIRKSKNENIIAIKRDRCPLILSIINNLVNNSIGKTS